MRLPRSQARSLVRSLVLTGRSIGRRGRSRPSGGDQGPLALQPRKLDECFERLTLELSSPPPSSPAISPSRSWQPSQYVESRPVSLIPVPVRERSDPELGTGTVARVQIRGLEARFCDLIASFASLDGLFPSQSSYCLSLETTARSQFLAGDQEGLPPPPRCSILSSSGDKKRVFSGA